VLMTGLGTDGMLFDGTTLGGMVDGGFVSILRV